VINLFIAVVLNNLDEAKTERLREIQQPPSADDILRELRTTQDALQRLQAQLEQTRPPRSQMRPARRRSLNQWQAGRFRERAVDGA
jgi:voltage-gated sodium channel